MRKARITPTTTIVGPDGKPTREGFNAFQSVEIYAVDVPAASGTGAIVRHGLDTSDVIVQIVEKATGSIQHFSGSIGAEITDRNTVTLSFSTSKAANSYRCIVLG